MDNTFYDMLKLQSGFEDFKKGSFDTEDALFFATTHNLAVGKSHFRSPRDVMVQDGMESIMGTLKEWTTSASRMVANWFKDYDKQEASRIEKEIKGGAAAFKSATLKDAAEAAKKTRDLVNKRFDSFYDSFKDKPYFKGLNKKDAKDKILKDIDKTIEGLKNPKMADLYNSQMKKMSEKYMLKIVAKISYLKKTHVKFKALLDRKITEDFVLMSGLYPNKLQELRKGGDAIIKKLEMIDKNGVVYLDIVKSKIFVDLELYVSNALKVIEILIDEVHKVSKALDGKSPNGEVSYGDYRHSVGDLRVAAWMSFTYCTETLDTLSDLATEVSQDINRTGLALAGIPEYVADALTKEK